MDIKAFEKELDLCLKKLYLEKDIDWSEIIDDLGLNIHPDTLRRMSYGYRKYHEYIQAKGIDNISNDMYNKLVDKELDIKKQMTKLSDMRVAVNKETREQSRYESLLDLLSENIERVNRTKIFENTSDYIYKEDSMKECVICLADIHYGLDVNNSWNVYNSDVAIDRMNHVVDKSISIGNINHCDIAHLLINGDLCSGNIHLTSRLSNRENITQQVTGVSELIAMAIKRLSDNFEYVMIHLVSGNHDRILPGKNDNGYEDNYINIIKDYIRIKTERLDNVIFNDNNDGHEIAEFNVCGKKFIALHGDKIPLKQMIPRLNSMYGNVDYVLRGHVHQDNLESFGNSKVITIPSFSGTDTYAQQLGLNSPPSQKVIVLEKDSNDELMYNIDLSNI